MTLTPENDRLRLQHKRRNRAISSAAAMFIVGWFVSAILFNLFEDSKIIPDWTLILITLFFPFFFGFSAWKTEMNKPLPHDQPTPHAPTVLKRVLAIISACFIFTPVFLFLYFFVTRMTESLPGRYSWGGVAFSLLLSLLLAFTSYRATLGSAKQAVVS